MSRVVGLVLVVGAAALPASAHHGFGRFDPTKEVMLEGTLTGIDFVNPHAYLYFESRAADGTVTPMRCEMRAATVLRRENRTVGVLEPRVETRAPAIAGAK